MNIQLLRLLQSVEHVLFKKNTLIIIFVITNIFCPVSSANYLGADVQTFSPIADQVDLISVQSGRTLKKGWWSFSLFGSYSRNNLLIYSLPISQQVRQQANDTLLASELNLAFGLNEHWEWGMGLPIYLDQKISDELIRKLYIQNGIVSIRNHFKYSLSDSKSEDGTAVIFTLDMPNVRNDPYVGRRVRPIFIIEIAYDKKYEDGIFAINAGYKVRQPTEMIPQATMWPLGDEFLYSLGWGQKFSEKSAMSYNFELVGSSPAGGSNYKKSEDISTLEGIVGIKGVVQKYNTWTIGAGYELLKESMSPEWRVFAGYTWSWPNSKRRKKDIILDKEINENSSTYQNTNPAWREQLNTINADDFDHDGVSEERDECPDTPPNIAVDVYGCPFDSDGDGVADFEDSCSNTPPQDVVDRKGCSVRY